MHLEIHENKQENDQTQAKLGCRAIHSILHKASYLNILYTGCAGPPSSGRRKIPHSEKHKAQYGSMEKHLGIRCADVY